MKYIFTALFLSLFLNNYAQIQGDWYLLEVKKSNRKTEKYNKILVSIDNHKYTQYKFGGVVFDKIDYKLEIESENLLLKLKNNKIYKIKYKIKGDILQLDYGSGNKMKFKKIPVFKNEFQLKTHLINKSFYINLGKNKYKENGKSKVSKNDIVIYSKFREGGKLYSSFSQYAEKMHFLDKKYIINSFSKWRFFKTAYSKYLFMGTHFYQILDCNTNNIKAKILEKSYTFNKEIIELKI
ncbi:MAG: hypothetical protein N4A49_02000 [Marinifilaceae bacterium]|jgi:hypothetical protein|nr:hypothetical protein [Marinifilaceae bacterium]